MKKYIYFIIGFWLVISLVIVLYNEIPFLSAETVYLKTRPYDPRDILKGDYVRLVYDINNISDTKNIIENNGHNGVYVILKKDNRNIAKFYDYSSKRPKEGLFIKGNFDGWSYNKNHRTYKFKYGIENYFTSSKNAKNYEQDLINGGYAEIIINKHGNARIKGVYKHID